MAQTHYPFHSWAQKVYSPNLSKSDCMSDVARIRSIITFHLSKLWKVKFSILCDVIFLVSLQGNFDIDHSWEWKGYCSIPYSILWNKYFKNKSLLTFSKYGKSGLYVFPFKASPWKLCIEKWQHKLLWHDHTEIRWEHLLGVGLGVTLTLCLGESIRSQNASPSSIHIMCILLNSPLQYGVLFLGFEQGLESGSHHDVRVLCGVI